MLGDNDEAFVPFPSHNITHLLILQSDARVAWATDSLVKQTASQKKKNKRPVAYFLLKKSSVATVTEPSVQQLINPYPANVENRVSS